MIEKKTVLDRIEIVGPVVHVRMKKLVLDDGRVIANEYHRATIEPGVSPVAMLAAVNAGVKSLGYGEVDESEWQRVAGIVSVVHTSDVIRAFRSKLAVLKTGVTP